MSETQSTRRLLALVASLAATLDGASAQVGHFFCWSPPNSTGAAATIAGAGSAALSRNDLVLSSSNLPQHAAAFFLCSRTPVFVPNPGGSVGNLCLGSPIGRVVGGVIVNSGAAGHASVAVDVHVMPQPNGAVVVQPGETWHFQSWFRDMAPGGGATSNLSPGLSVQFSAALTTPALVLIPPGTFAMGSDASTGAPYFNLSLQRPVHDVTISAPFWMGRYEVTQAEYLSLRGIDPAYFPGPQRPVERVTWHDARAYCEALTALSAGTLPAGYEYRLPTEAEWEYACRAGTTTEFHYGPDLLCPDARFRFSQHSSSDCGVTSLDGTAPVGGYAPNAFGLYDMHGNVFEWCLDSWAPYDAAPATDPFVTGGTERIFRGGGWGSDSSDCRSARRVRRDTSYADFGLGFRVVLAPALVP